MFKVSFKTKDIKSESLTIIRQSFMSKTFSANGPSTKGDEVTTVIAMNSNETFRLGAVLALGGIDKNKLIEYGDM